MLIEIFAEIIFLLRSCVKGIVAVREKIRHFALKKKRNPRYISARGQFMIFHITSTSRGCARTLYTGFDVMYAVIARVSYKNRKRKV